jgi:hypothetical protein
MRVAEESLFKRFVLFAKSDDDGMLVGYDDYEVYHVVATWNHGGQDLWLPETNIVGKPVTM